ncbi:MAG: single-stranded DNA-binding protein [Actinomycetota bacterium]|nr:single-stranded DNA-binding protein [Actinomycetota bacterium]
MASENTVTLVGNIADDPELRFTPSGLPVANFTVAVNRRVPKEGAWEDKLEGFFRCSCWRDMAENVAESLQKGSRVMVVGRLQQRSWEDQEGNKRSTVEVQVDEVGPSLRWATARPERSQRSGGGSGGGGSQPAPQPSSGGDSWGPPASVGGAIPDEGGF